MVAVLASSVTGAVVVSTWVIRCVLSCSHVSVRWTLKPTQLGRAFLTVMGMKARRVSYYTRQREGYSPRNANSVCLRSTDSSGPTPAAQSRPLALIVTRREHLAGRGRSVSPTQMRRLMARILANTLVESVRCLPRALSQPRSLKSVSMADKRCSSTWPVIKRARNATLDRGVKAGVREF